MSNPKCPSPGLLEESPVVPFNYGPHKQPPTELRIEVPRTESSALGDAIQFEPSPVSTSPDMGSITQLPTPVLGGGQFPVPPTTQFQSIDIRKRHDSPFAGKNRVVSALDHEAAFAARASSSPVDVTTPIKTRYISNPVRMEDARTPSEMPSPPLESSFSELVGQIFEAPNLERSYICTEIVGQGSFSCVVSATNLEDRNDTVAVKIISVPANDASNFRSYITRELGILLHVRHPCIVQLVDYNVSMGITQKEIDDTFYNVTAFARNFDHAKRAGENNQYFFLKYCSGGNLLNWLDRNHKMMSNLRSFWQLMARIVAELVVTVAHINKNRIIHRDIKLENILLTKNHDCTTIKQNPSSSSAAFSVVTDFGLSKRLESENQMLSTKCGSQDYVSPELLMGLEYNGKLLDAWAVGVVVYCMLENRLPFDAPPLDLLMSSGISPSVTKRRRNKSPGHRIAMIDWDWYELVSLLKKDELDDESKQIINQLKTLVEALLVRKEKRSTMEHILESAEFSWIRKTVPTSFYG